MYSANYYTGIYIKYPFYIYILLKRPTFQTQFICDDCVRVKRVYCRSSARIR